MQILTLSPQIRFGLRLATPAERRGGQPDPSFTPYQIALVKHMAALHQDERDLFDLFRVNLPPETEAKIELEGELQAHFEQLRRQGQSLRERLGQTGLAVDRDSLFDAIQYIRYGEMAKHLQQRDAEMSAIQEKPLGKPRNNLEQRWWRKALRQDALGYQLESLGSSILNPNWPELPQKNYGLIDLEPKQLKQIHQWSNLNALIQSARSLAVFKHFARPSAMNMAKDDESRLAMVFHHEQCSERTSPYAQWVRRADNLNANIARGNDQFDRYSIRNLVQVATDKLVRRGLEINFATPEEGQKRSQKSRISRHRLENIGHQARHSKLVSLLLD